MPSRKLPSDPQNISLRRWRVMEIESPDGSRTRHVWGHDVTNNQGRASSPIQAFEVDSMSVTTRSGKTYKLVGLPGNAKLGRSAWLKWCRDNSVVSDQDVTDEYLNVNQISTVGFKKINSAVNQ